MEKGSFIDSLVQWGLSYIEVFTDEVPEEILHKLGIAIEREWIGEIVILICLKYLKETKGRIGAEKGELLNWIDCVITNIVLERLRRRGLLRFSKPIHLFPVVEDGDVLIERDKRKWPFHVY
jgi:hypothetical protein